ncbi:MAG: hypothetical protein K5853_05890, partial [Lachnospiraceae bacterium]|nr:hypothetical protein [Lachnospiraceae bacterium]
MEYKKGFRAVRATKRSRILLSIGLVASFAIIIFMILQTKNATEVNAAETKEQLNGMLTNLDEMNTTIQRSRETIRDSAKHMSSTSNINHETTNLETLQTDIYETQNEITNLLTEMDEGKVSDVDEKVSAIGQD